MAKVKRNFHIGGEQLPLIVPESSWKPPATLPDLRGKIDTLVVDVENRDDGIAAGRGSSWPYKGGHLAGLAAAWDFEDGTTGSLYAPVRHPDSPECFDPDAVKRWYWDHAQAGIRIVAHHSSHDTGWLRAEWGLKPPPNLDDTEAMAMAVDENRLAYDLDSLCRWRGVPGKDETLLREAAAAYGIDPKADMWKMPARFVGPYAEQDALAELGLARDLEQELEEQGLLDAHRLERDLLPMVHEMRWRGIRVNVDRAEQARDDMYKKRDDVLRDLSHQMGAVVTLDHVRSAKWLEQAHDDAGINYPMTASTKKHPKGQPSFTKEWMRKHTHFLPRLVSKVDQYENMASKFIQGFILDYTHRGRIHASINQFRGEEGGTRSFRFSYSDPALQQMPSRDEEFTDLTRGCFEPEDHEKWAAIDYSQQEYRLIVHFAVRLGCRKAEEAAALYRADERTDFHSVVAEWTGLDRKPAKDANFAKAFGAGVYKFAEMTGKTVEEAKDIMELYDTRLPFVKELAQRCDSLAQRRGYIKLIDGARSHFDLWEPAWRRDLPADYAGVSYMPEGKAREWAAEVGRALKRPPIKMKRAFTHKAGNRLIQGSAARQTKMAMRECWRAGLVPLIQMHDELCFSVRSPEQGEAIGKMMREVVRLEVPMQVDVEYGRSWGDAKHKEWKEAA